MIKCEGIVVVCTYSETRAAFPTKVVVDEFLD